MRLIILTLLFVLFSWAQMSEVDQRLEAFNKNMQLNMLEAELRPLPRSTGESYVQLQPPNYANVYQVSYWDDKATFYLWYQDGKNFIRVVPQTASFFVCGVDFTLIDDNGAQHDVGLIQFENGSSFCNDLYTPVTFKITSRYTDPFDDTEPIQNLIYEGYERGKGKKIYHMSVGTGETSSNSSSEASTSSSSSSSSDCLSLIKDHSDPDQIRSILLQKKSIEINGYYIHYGDGNYDWIYIPSSSGNIYKLEKGVDKNYNLRWLHIPNIHAQKNGDRIEFR